MRKYRVGEGCRSSAWGSAIIEQQITGLHSAAVLQYAYYGPHPNAALHRRDYSDSDARAVAEWLNERERGYAPKTAYDHRRTP